MPPPADVYLPTASDLKRLFDTVRAHWKGPRRNGHVPMRQVEKRYYLLRDLALLSLLIDTGLRVKQEALELTIEALSLDTAEPFLLVRNQKGGGQRSLPLSTPLVAQLQAYLSVRPKGTPHNPVAPSLFLSIYGEACRYSQVQKTIMRYRRQAGLEHVTLHSLRHFYLTEMAEVNIFAAQQAAGQTDHRTIQKYAHKRAKHLRDTHIEANPLGKVIGDAASSPSSSRRKRV